MGIKGESTTANTKWLIVLIIFFTVKGEELMLSIDTI